MIYFTESEVTIMTNQNISPNPTDPIFDKYNDVVTVPELAKMLRVGRNTAYDLIKDGRIQSVRVKNQIRIPKSSVIEFLKCG